MNITAYNLVAGQSNGIALSVAPGVAFTLRIKGSTDAGMVVMADANGYAAIYVNPSGALNNLIFTLEWDNAVQQEIAFTATTTPAATAAFAIPANAGAATRPALSGDQAQQLTNDELLGQGYPMRPDSVATPLAYEAWQKAVSAPATTITPQLVSQPFIRCGNVVQSGQESTTNWCGYMLMAQTGGDNSQNFDWVTGTWELPVIKARIGANDYLAIWVGLDNKPDLVQAGTEQNCYACTYGSVSIAFYQYYAWVELLPNQPTQQVVANFPVGPGDNIHMQVWIGNNEAPFMPTLTGGYAVFNFENLTKQTHTRVYTPLDGTTVTGSYGLWIVERPLDVSSKGYPPLPLAQFSTFNLSGPSVHKNIALAKGNDVFQLYREEENAQIDMSGLAGVVPVTQAHAMTFTWAAHE